ncbi:hypothetical protein [Candidatus Uabimicrobium sp. HlEnr_7]|uniref:hypothetical protein n=1 Tax=Candidatus Uabimicrobium helgolandensis TaxID=3095367 RepID=UPI00355609C4
MFYRQLLWIILSSLLWVACSTPKLVNHTAHRNQIVVGAGPEDMELVTVNEQSHLLVSCLERRSKGYEGDFWLIDLATDKPRRVERRGEPMGLIFRPHGLSTIKNDTGSFDVYVIHHGQHGDGNVGEGIYGHAILVYEWKDGFLHYKRAYYDSLLVNPNDLFVLENGSFYVTNAYFNPPVGFCQLLGICERSTVVYFNNEKWSKVAEGLEYANGVHYLPQSKEILISTSVSGNVWSYKRNVKTGGLSEKRLLFDNINSGDNFSYYDKDTLLLTSHANGTKFTLHAISPRVSSPTIVWRIHWREKRIDPIYYNKGGDSINGGSTAILHNNKLYISQVFAPFIEVVDLRHRDFSTSYQERRSN